MANRKRETKMLLIEPQGIEITHNVFSILSLQLLIEPQGIEIRIRFVGNSDLCLLIEPQGIEIGNSQRSIGYYQSF